MGASKNEDFPRPCPTDSSAPVPAALPSCVCAVTVSTGVMSPLSPQQSICHPAFQGCSLVPGEFVPGASAWPEGVPGGPSPPPPVRPALTGDATRAIWAFQSHACVSRAAPHVPACPVLWSLRVLLTEDALCSAGSAGPWGLGDSRPLSGAQGQA